MVTQWTITKDHIKEEGEPEGSYQNARTIVGPRNATLSHEEIVAHKDGQKFRLYDDDGNLYYDGVLVDCEDDEDYGDEGIFRPLNEFGTPNAGAVILKVKEGRKWVTV
jgi:hypothetical protein